MAVLIPVQAKCDICFLYTKEQTAVEIRCYLISVSSENLMNKQIVAKWYYEF